MGCARDKCVVFGTVVAAAMIGCESSPRMSAPQFELPRFDWGSSGDDGRTPAPDEREARSGIERAELDRAEQSFVAQRREDWCWAASCEMALRSIGVRDVTQEMLVEQIKGSAEDQRAIELDIVRALATDGGSARAGASNRRLPTQVALQGQKLIDGSIQMGRIYTSSDGAIEDLQRGEPTLIFLRDWDGAPYHVGFVKAIEFRRRGSDFPDLPGVKQAADSVARGIDQLVGNARYEVVRIEFLDPMSATGSPARVIDGEAIAAHARGYLSRRHAREIERELESVLVVR